MKKVLFTATVDSHILQFHLPFLKLFKEKGYEVHVATNGDEEIPYCDVKHKVCFERSPFKLNNLKAIGQMKKICENEKFDIIHTHTPMGSVVTRLGAIKSRKKFKTRVIYTAHGLHFFKGAPLKNWLIFYPVEKFLSRFTDTLILINQEDYDLCKRKFKKCRDIQYVPGVGINEEKFNFEMTKKEKKVLRESLGLKEKDFVMIYPAELNQNKNQEMIISAIEVLSNKYKDIKVLLPGVDSLNGYYQKLVKEKGLDDYILFLGYRKDIPRLLKISDASLATSYREGLPLNVMEAMYVGLPIVATNCRGQNELVKDHINGYLVTIGDQNRFIECIEKLYLSRNENDRFGEQSKYIVKEYLLDKIIFKLEKIYFKKKKVLHVLASNKFSGAENVACTIIENLKKEFEFVYCCPNGQIKDVLEKKNIEYIPIKKLSYTNLKNVIKEYKPDIIHAHDYKASCLASLFKGSIIISHIHQNSTKMREKNILTLIYKLCSSKFNNIIYVSDSALDDYYYKSHVLNKSMVLYNVIDISAINNKSKEFIVEKNYDLIFLGRLAIQKNPERLIKIMNDLIKINSNVRLAIIGDGEKKEIISKMIHELHIENNIDMLGYQSNPYPYLKNGKILIMTSFFEGTPMAALEAMNFKLTIVSTPVDGLKKIVKNNYNGFLYDSDDEIVNCINSLLSDKDKLNKIRKNSYDFFLEYNNLEKYCDVLRNIYK